MGFRHLPENSDAQVQNLGHMKHSGITQPTVRHDLGGFAGHEHMARPGLQRQAETEIALEFGSDLGAISDGSPSLAMNTAPARTRSSSRDLAGVKSLKQRRDDAFGFSGE